MSITEENIESASKTVAGKDADSKKAKKGSAPKAKGGKARSGKSRATPLMGQYEEIKSRHPDAILLFRVGDFYETFGADAVLASKVLGIVLTKRSNGAASETELAGFPYHALDNYLPKFVAAGMRVAICEQLEDPKKTKKLVKRGVTELVTPGLAVGEKILDYRRNNYLAALNWPESSGARAEYGISLLDVSTGEFSYCTGEEALVDRILESLQPAEVLVPRSRMKAFNSRHAGRFYAYPLEDWIFNQSFGRDKLSDHFGTASLKGFGISGSSQAIGSAGAIIHYLGETEHHRLEHITGLRRLTPDKHMWLDRFSIRNLELFQPNHPDGKALIEVLDRTSSAMGARMLRRWLAMPLTDSVAIGERLDAVEFLTRDSEKRADFRDRISRISDLERLLAKVAMGKASPRDAGSIRNALRELPDIAAFKDEVPSHGSGKVITRMCSRIRLCPELLETLEKGLADELPVQLGKGPTIRQGLNPELDELRQLGADGRGFLAQLQAREAERTGISSLKVGFNNVFGYYLEVTHRFKDRVPEDWIRKQTLVSAERYITAELKEYEEKILGAEEKISALEARLFADLLVRIAQDMQNLQESSAILAELDILSCFATNALDYSYRRPELLEEPSMSIRQGRHPVIERTLPGGNAYVPNDLDVDTEHEQILIITGPNMSGKSALLRQTALITLMAQIGSFVPAESAAIGLVDRLFTRVGASDNIASGESTFMVEMQETASIVNNLSARSLILLDEIGRGTSTYDGISIAWSLAEYLHEHPQARPRTLFATHYHELSDLADRFGRVRNYHVTTRETGGKVIFLRKLAPGGTKHSFGIHVAQMAGMPRDVVDRAREILTELEQKSLKAGGLNPGGLEPDTAFIPARASSRPYQLSFFEASDPRAAELLEKLNNLDPDSMTPLEALQLLNDWKGSLEE